MSHSKGRLTLATVLLTVNLAVIWGNSMLPAEISAAISGWVRDLIGGFLPGSGEGPISADGDGPLRKLAHFLEFGCLGLCLTWLLGLLKKPAGLALVWGFAAACVDETIQVFVPGRGPAFTDVLLDTAGVLTGLFVLLFIRHRQHKNNPAPQNEMQKDE